MRIAVVGSRNYPRLNEVRDIIRIIKIMHPDAVIVSGGANGVDTVAVEEAEKLGLKTKIWPANWKLNGKRAGILRNYDIINDADMVIAFHYTSGKSGPTPGTAHDIEIAESSGKTLLKYEA